MDRGGARRRLRVTWSRITAGRESFLRGLPPRHGPARRLARPHGCWGRGAPRLGRRLARWRPRGRARPARPLCWSLTRAAPCASRPSRPAFVGPGRRRRRAAAVANAPQPVPVAGRRRRRTAGGAGGAGRDSDSEHLRTYAWASRRVRGRVWLNLVGAQPDPDRRHHRHRHRTRPLARLG